MTIRCCHCGRRLPAPPPECPPASYVATGDLRHVVAICEGCTGKLTAEQRQAVAAFAEAAARSSEYVAMGPGRN